MIVFNDHDRPSKLFEQFIIIIFNIGKIKKLFQILNFDSNVILPNPKWNVISFKKYTQSRYFLKTFIKFYNNNCDRACLFAIILYYRF